MNSFISQAWAVMLALILLVGSARGQAPERWPGAPATEVIVTVTDTTLDIPTALPEGLMAFRVTNAGNEAHNFEIAGTNFQTRFARNLEPGETRALRVYLDAGRYTVYCPIEAHGHTPVELTVRYAERIR